MDKKPLYIIIHGYKGSGKTTLANSIERVGSYSGYKTIQRPLANPARKILSDGFKIPYEYFSDTDLKDVPYKDNDFTPREMLQQFATEFSQTFFGKEVWCKYVQSEIDKINPELVVIPDVRFTHEMEYYENLDAPCIFVFLKREGHTISDTHISENGLYHIYNKNRPTHISLNTENVETNINQRFDVVATQLITRAERCRRFMQLSN